MPSGKSNKKTKVTTQLAVEQTMTGVGQLSAALLLFSAASIVVLLLANLFFPQYVVLGTNLVSPIMAAIYSMVVLSFISVGSLPIIEYVIAQQKMKFTSAHWMLLYWIINIIGLWWIGRFAELLGLGLRSWLVVVVLGLVINVAQGLVMTRIVSKV